MSPFMYVTLALCGGLALIESFTNRSLLYRPAPAGLRDGVVAAPIRRFFAPLRMTLQKDAGCGGEAGVVCRDTRRVSLAECGCRFGRLKPAAPSGKAKGACRSG